MIASARRRGVLAVALIALVARVATGCGSPAASPSVPMESATALASGAAGIVRVTLGLYSGRADPSWALAVDEAAALDRAIAALPRAVGVPPEGGLGYHGFTIERPDGTLVAYRGAVAAAGQGRRAFLSDPARTVERLLVESARGHVTAAELAEARRSVAAP